MYSHVTVLYASQMGAAQELAGRAADDLTEAGIPAKDVDMFDFTLDQLQNCRLLLVIGSTWGDGEPPDGAEDFFFALRDAETLDLSHIHYAVFALGDTSYEHFCQFGKDMDALLEKHGAQRLRARVECDLDEQARYPGWIREMAVIFSSRLETIV